MSDTEKFTATITAKNTADDDTKKDKALSKADLEQQNAELRAQLDALLAEKPATANAPVKSFNPDDPMRTVEITLPYDGERYKDDLYVCVNHRNFQIRRGVPVTVPFYVAQAVRESAEQDVATARLIAIKEMEFAGLVEKGVL